jgi:hypothetical protein
MADNPCPGLEVGKLSSVIFALLSEILRGRIAQGIVLLGGLEFSIYK